MVRLRNLELPLAALLSLAGCAAEDGAAGPDASGVDVDPDQPDAGSEAPESDAGPDDTAPVAFQTCADLEFAPAGEPAGFDHFSNELTSQSGGPTHRAQDVIVTPSENPTVSARFTYSAFSLEIEDELVRVSLDTCDGWQALGERRTDDDGRITVELGEPLPAGVYRAVFEVAADETTASAYVWSLPAGTRLAVFDIDGTLTSSETDVYEDLLFGDNMPSLYPDAQTLTTARDGQGYIPIYLAGRPGFLAGTTRSWLAEQGFARGILHFAESAGDLLPTDSGVGAYKRDFLSSFADAGMVVEVGYGNAPTDIFAYLSAGLAPGEVWIIGSHAGEEGTHAVTGAWSDVAADVAAEPAIEQPFKR